MSEFKQFLQHSVDPDPYDQSVFLRLEVQIRRSGLERQSDEFHDEITRLHRIPCFKDFIYHYNRSFSCGLFLLGFRFPFLFNDGLQIGIPAERIGESCRRGIKDFVPVSLVFQALKQ